MGELAPPDTSGNKRLVTCRYCGWRTSLVSDETHGDGIDRLITHQFREHRLEPAVAELMAAFPEQAAEIVAND
jgi:hypothetical protein